MSSTRIIVVAALTFALVLSPASGRKTRPDRTAPIVTITSGPGNGTATNATFAFTATDNVGVAGVDCSLDGSTFSICASPKAYSGLGATSHTFVARARDAAGNLGSASWSWTINSPTVGCACGSALPAPLPESSGPVVVGSNAQSLESLFSSLAPGTILQLHGGSYGPINSPKGDVAVALNASGTATNPITIESYPGESATIARRIDVYGSYIRIRDVKITRNAVPTDTRYSQSSGNPGGNVGIWLRSSGSHRTLEHSEVYGNTMSGIFGGGTFDQVLANRVHDNGTTPDDHGFYFTGGQSLLANNLVVSNYDFGVQLGYGAAVNNVISNNTSVENGKRDPTHPGSGFVTFSGAQPNLFVNNIAAGNAEFGFKTYDATNTLSHNDTFGNPAGPTYGTFASNAMPLSSDPMFVGLGDYHLQPGSPVIGYGDPAYVPSTDFDGRARSSPDLGAFGH